MFEEEEFEAQYTFKIVIAGNSGVGKTNLISRYVRDEFSEESSPTIGVDFQAKCETINNINIKLQFWDTAGQEKHKAIANSYYKQANGAILAYDLTDKHSFEKLSFWLEEIQNSAPKDMKIILLGNKSDLQEERQVSEEEGLTFAKENGFFFMEVSAKENEDGSVNKAFKELMSEILNDMKGEREEENKKDTALRSDTLTQINVNKTTPEKKGGCC